MDERSQALLSAIESNQVDEVLRVIADGVDINAVLDYGPPIIRAYGKPAIVRVLVEHGADIDYAGFS